MATVTVSCIHCSSDKVYKHGRAASGLPRYRCRECRRSFQQDYRYEANKQGVREKIVEMALNGSGVRDTARVLGVSTTTVVTHLKNSHQAQSTRWQSEPKPERKTNLLS